MPELPEVETVKTILNTILKDEIIVRVDILYARMVLNDISYFKLNLEGHKINQVRRTGKYLLIDLDHGMTLISHLRMEGKYILLSDQEKVSSHARIIFTLKSKKRVSYDDSRMFGIMKIVPTGELHLEPMLRKLGKEPFDLTAQELYQRINHINRPIKSVLLDQSIISGLGNIYVDEVLFDVKINPFTLASQLNFEQCEKIIVSSIKVLNKAIELGGSTVKSYHAARDVSGMFQNELMAYGKEHEPCPNCQTLLKKVFVGQRGTTFCPNCQKLQKSQVIIGITGKVASGKSSVLKVFKDKGFYAVSADEVIKELYKDETVRKKVYQLARIPFHGDFDSLKIFKAMLDNIKIKHRIEKYLHPLVEAVFLSKIKTIKSRYIALEVPLLYQAGFQYMCDKVIIIEVSRDQQILNLKARNCINISETLRFNDSSNFDELVKNADFMIKCNGNLEYLKSQVLDVISFLDLKM